MKRKPQHSNFEVSIILTRNIPAGADVLRMVILQIGLPKENIVVKEENGRVAVSAFFRTQKEADKISRLVRRIRLNGIRLCSHHHQRKEWESKWKEGWKPFPLTKQFCVVPLWQDHQEPIIGMVPLYLDTTSAFGTGLHETTRFTARLIEGFFGHFDSFLDIGTGSGILAILASKLGCQHVEAIDIDPDAVKVARQNFKANALTARGVRRLDILTGKLARQFDLVAANLITHDLVRYKDRICSCIKPGGHLVVSGISLKNLSQFRKEFVVLGIVFVSMIKGREWAALCFWHSPNLQSSNKFRVC